MADQAGDTFFEKDKYSHNIGKEPHFEFKECKFSYSSMMESQINRLRNELEHWREIILQGKKVFFWEKQWYPTALIGGSTILFTFLWLLDPSILTVISVLGLVITICDYLIPSIASSLFKADKWTARKEQEFEEICTNIVLFKARLELAWAYYYNLKSTNRKMYFGLTMSILSLLAWIGCAFNNLFLAYVLLTILLLLPGMEHNGMIQKWSAYVNKFLMEILRQKSKGREKHD